MFDLIILGAGPAGLSAAIYAGRYKLNAAVIDSSFGGTLREIPLIENYPGFESISGAELANKMIAQVKKYGIRFIQEEVKRIEKEQGREQFIIKTEDNKYKAKAVILAMGMKHRILDVPGEKEFAGKGVSYCFTCDAPLFQDKTVAVVGGANSACIGSLILSGHAKRVYLIYRKDKLRGEPITVEKIKDTKNIEVIYNAHVREINGRQFVEEVVLGDGKRLKVDGVFVQIGAVPANALLENIKADKEGYIVTDENQATNILGVFAAGDITSRNVIKQVVSAASDGAVAAISSYKYIIKNK